MKTTLEQRSNSVNISISFICAINPCSYGENKAKSTCLRSIKDAVHILGYENQENIWRNLRSRLIKGCSDTG